MSQHRILYFSAAGTTRLLAETIQTALTKEGHSVQICKCTDSDPQRELTADLAAQPTGLWVGSPVYCDHALPHIVETLQQLPKPPVGSYAVLFVTWGGVTSGLALYEMAHILSGCGWPVVAAAKVLSEHSSMFRAATPLAQGQPSRTDLDRLQQLVHTVTEKERKQTLRPLAHERLNYLSDSLRNEAQQKSLAKAKVLAPLLGPDESLCTQCGLCAIACPVFALELQPYPKIAHKRCVLCLQCIRSCPEDAFPFDHQALACRINAMAEASDEEKISKFFD